MGPRLDAPVDAAGISSSATPRASAKGLTMVMPTTWKALEAGQRPDAFRAGRGLL
jgi:DNA primase